MNKALYYQNSCLGVLGENTDSFAIEESLGRSTNVELRVGDVISFYEYGRIYTKVVAKDSMYNTYGVFGFGTNRLDFKHLTKVLSYEDLTEDMFQKLQEGRSNSKKWFKIKDASSKEMTLEDIEKELGYKVKIKS